MSEEQKKPGSFGKGFGLVFLCHLLLFILPIAWLYAGVAQLPYVLILYFVYRKRQETATCQGILVAASVTFLLNAACQGLVFMMMHG